MLQVIFIDKKSIPIHRGHIIWLILCFLLKFITYTAHFCTFICNTTQYNCSQTLIIAEKYRNSSSNTNFMYRDFLYSPRSGDVQARYSNEQKGADESEIFVNAEDISNKGA